MVFPILGANTESAVYEVSNSLRFNDDDDPKLQRTTGSNSNRQKFTFSAWVKKAQDVNEDQTIFSANDGGHQPHIKFDNTHERLNVRLSDSSSYNVQTAMSFRDVSAWYHIVVAVDTTQSTASNRVKIYVNGTQQTDLVTENYPAQNFNTPFNSNTELTLGRDVSTNNKPFDGYMAEVFWIDGTQYAASNFGKTNSNGVWIPIDAKPNLSFGTHGFYFEFKETGTGTNSSGMGADTSGQDNHFAVTNLTSIDVTTDTPTNNFATMNPLDNYYSEFTFSEGNCKFVTDGSAVAYNTATIGDLKRGKWYLEFKYTDPAHTDSGSTMYGEIAVIGQKLADSNSGLFPSNQQHNFAYGASNGRIKSNNQAGTVHGSTIDSDGDIIGFLIDLDNNRVTTHKNGSYADGSGNHDESSPTHYVSITDPASTPLGGYMIGSGESVSSSESGNQNTGTYEINFGNPSFSISSGNSDANGYGNFEYAVPSGYYALCTKNLAEYG